MVVFNNYSPLRYPGGKNSTYDYVKMLIKQNNSEVYIEPFAGGCAVGLKLLLNNDIKRLYINDFDKSIYSFWYAVLFYPEELCDLIKNAEFSISEWKRQREIQKNKESEEILKLGFSTLYLNRTNRSGILKAGVIGGVKQKGNYKMDCRFNKDTLIKKINLISQKKSRISLYNKDAIDFIKQNITKTKNSFTFLDPPYYKKGKDLYINFYEHVDHEDLSLVIDRYISNKDWILTYDVVPEIFNIYNKYEHYTYYLNYSISTSRKGMEFIFFSDRVSSYSIGDYLNISS